MRRNLALLALAACFSPSYGDATRCGGARGDECPPGRSCQQGQCLVPGTPDAPLAADAPTPDAPGADAGPPFTLVFTGTPRVVRGQSPYLLFVSVTRAAGFTAPITLSLLDLPTGVSAGTENSS